MRGNENHEGKLGLVNVFAITTNLVIRHDCHLSQQNILQGFLTNGTHRRIYPWLQKMGLMNDDAPYTLCTLRVQEF